MRNGAGDKTGSISQNISALPCAASRAAPTNTVRPPSKRFDKDKQNTINGVNEINYWKYMLKFNINIGICFSNEIEHVRQLSHYEYFVTEGA